MFGDIFKKYFNFQGFYIVKLILSLNPSAMLKFSILQTSSWIQWVILIIHLVSCLNYLNLCAVLQFSKLYKFIVKIVIFHFWNGTTINDQFLCCHFSFKSYAMIKLVIYLGQFQFSSYPMTKLVIYLGHFQLVDLKFLNFGHSL